MIKIEITNTHGTFTTDTMALDIMIMRYLPASPIDLRARLTELTGIPEHAYNDVYAASELLIMLADATGYPNDRGIQIGDHNIQSNTF